MFLYINQALLPLFLACFGCVQGLKLNIPQVKNINQDQRTATLVFSWDPEGSSCYHITLDYQCTDLAAGQIEVPRPVQTNVEQTLPIAYLYDHRNLQDPCSLTATCTAGMADPQTSQVIFDMGLDNQNNLTISPHAPPPGGSASSPSPSASVPTSTIVSSSAGPGTLLGSSGLPSLVGPSPAATSSLSVSATTMKKPIGAIVGGVIGGIIGLLVLVGIVIYFLRRRRRMAMASRGLPSSEAFDPRSPTMQQAWSDEMAFVVSTAEGKTRAVTATPDALARMNDSHETHPSHQGLSDGLESKVPTGGYSYPPEKDPTQWASQEETAPYRRASFTSQSEDDSVFLPQVERSGSPVLQWDSNRFVRSPSPH